jgi:hypothetical protein
LLKQRHDFESWSTRNRLGEALFVRNYLTASRSLPEWRIEREEEIRLEGLRRCLRSFWTMPARGPEAAIRLDVWECESRAAAHELLVRSLLGFESPLVERRDDLPLGDVAFAPPESGSVAFSRANLVFVVSRAGRADVPVAEFARRLDEDTIAKPEPSGAGSGERIRGIALEAPGIASREGSALRVETAEPAGRPQMLKFFSSTGEIEERGGELVYREAAPGPANITVFAVGAEGGVERRALGQ